MTAPKLRPQRPATRFGRNVPKEERYRREQGAAGASNGKLKPVMIKHGGKSAVLSARIYKRSREYVYIQEHAGHLIQQMGGPEMVTTTMGELIEQAARLKLLESVAFAETLRTGVVSNGQVSPALAAFLSVVVRRASLLQVLGLERRQKELTLGELLSRPAQPPVESNDPDQK